MASPRQKSLYLAGPLFGLAEREFNERLAAALEILSASLKVVLPQRRAEQLLKQDNGLELVFRDCLEMIDRSDVVVSIVDGADADSGTCVELGYAFAKGKVIIGVRTDSRGSEDRGMNLMVSHLCTALIISKARSTEALAKEIVDSVGHVGIL